MKPNNLLLIPRPNILLSYGFGTIILLLYILPIWGGSAGLSLLFESGHSIDCFAIPHILIFVFGLRLIFLHKILEFQKEGQSLTIYWGIGFPFRNWFIKLPWIWRDYSGDQIIRLRVARGWRIDGSPGTEGYRVYNVKAKIVREWIQLAEYLRLKSSLDVSMTIADFLRVPLDKSRL